MINSLLPDEISCDVERAMVLFNNFQAIWGHKWSQNIEQSTLEMALALWAEILKPMSDELVNTTFKKCAHELEWPPSLAEFARIADRLSGVPTPREALQLAIRRDSSPLAVKIVREIGSWDLSRCSERELLKRVEAIMKEFRVMPSKEIEDEKHGIRDYGRCKNMLEN